MSGPSWRSGLPDPTADGVAVLQVGAVPPRDMVHPTGADASPLLVW